MQTFLAAVLAPLARQVRRAAVEWKQRRCKHLFRGPDLRRRDAEGMVSWPCSKCGKMHHMEYGLLAPGEITGPWGVRDERA